MRIFLFLFLFFSSTHNTSSMVPFDDYQAPFPDWKYYALSFTPHILFLCTNQIIKPSLTYLPTTNAQIVGMSISCFFAFGNWIDERSAGDDCLKEFETLKIIEIPLLLIMHGCFLFANGNIKSTRHWGVMFGHLLLTQIISWEIVVNGKYKEYNGMCCLPKIKLINEEDIPRPYRFKRTDKRRCYSFT